MTTDNVRILAALLLVIYYRDYGTICNISCDAAIHQDGRMLLRLWLSNDTKGVKKSAAYLRAYFLLR